MCSALYGKFRIGNADHSGNNYRHVLHYIRTNSSSFTHGESVRGWTDSQFRLNGDGVDNTLGYSLNVEITVFDPFNSSTYTTCRHESVQQTSNASNVIVTRGGCVYTNTDSPVTGMSFLQSGGNHESDVYVYGIKK